MDCMRCCCFVPSPNPRPPLQISDLQHGFGWNCRRTPPLRCGKLLNISRQISPVIKAAGDGEIASSPAQDLQVSVADDDGEGYEDIEIDIQKSGKNSTRIAASIVVNAPLDAVWSVLTDYEGLADFIPGLAVSQLIERRENGATLLQIGQQEIAFGLVFKAKGIIDVYENKLEILATGIRREIDFKMVDGDFKTFEGKWSIEQPHEGRGLRFSDRESYQTLLSYCVNVQPKRWLPVSLVEGRLTKDIKVNLTCVRGQATSIASKAICQL